MKTVRCLCDCGALNRIPLPKRSPRGRLPLFYCHDCGKPSYDLCGCGNRMASESHHRFCQVCGAGGEDIRRGVEAIDLRRNFRAFVFGTIQVSLLLCAPIAMPWMLDPNHMPRWFIGLDAIVLGWLFGMRLLCPFYALLTGERKAPLSWRALPRFMGLEPEKNELANLTRSALKLRTRIKIARRRTLAFIDKYRSHPSRGT